MLVEKLEFLFNVIRIIQVDITGLTSGPMKLLLASREDTSEDPRSFGNTSVSHCDLASRALSWSDKKTKKAISTSDCCGTGLDKISPVVSRFGLSWYSTRLRRDGGVGGERWVRIPVKNWIFWGQIKY